MNYSSAETVNIANQMQQTMVNPENEFSMGVKENGQVVMSP